MNTNSLHPPSSDPNSGRDDYPDLPAISISPGSYPTIIIDTREQDILPIRYPFVAEIDGLPTGDYSYRGGENSFAVERKSIADLTGCLGVDRDRFRRQLERMKAYDFRRLLIVGSKSDLETGNYRSRLSPKAAMHSLHAIEAKYLPVVWADTPEGGARLVEKWAFWHFREMINAVKRSSK